MPTEARARPTASFALLVLLLGPALLADPAAAATTPCVTLDVGDAGAAALAAVKSLPGVDFWVEAEADLLLCGSPAALATAAGAHRLRAWHPAVDRQRLHFLRRAHDDDLGVAGVEVLARGGRYAVVEVAPGADLDAPWHPFHDAREGSPGPHTVGAALLPFRPGAVLARRAANLPPRALGIPDPAVQAIVDAVDPDRWFAAVETLAGFESRPGTASPQPNRNTRGFTLPPEDPGGIIAARDWLAGELAALGLTVTTPSFEVEYFLWTVDAFNVVGRLEGTTRPDEWWIVGAHYDARNSNNSNWDSFPAPGAEDNGSGCAGVLELAHILAAHPPETTVLFACYSGEEQGLFGSTDHAQDIVAAGDADKVQGMLNMDMIGYTADAELDCLIESYSLGQGMIDDLVAAAGLYAPALSLVIDNQTPCCSDHMPYLNRGMPAVLTIENDWGQYPAYHKSTDVPANLSLAMGAEILHMNAAALAQWTGAGAAVDSIFTDGFESGDTAAWSAAVP